MHSPDPMADLLNIEPTTREFVHMPLTNKFFHKIETDFTAEPWDVPIAPVKLEKPKTRFISFKAPAIRIRQ